MCFYFYSQPVEDSGVPRESPLDSVDQSPLLRGLHVNHAGVSLRDLLRDSPFNMLIKKWVLTPTTFQRGKGGVTPGGIAEGDSNITQPAQMTNTANSRSFRNF